MKNDAMLVEPEMIAAVRAEVAHADVYSLLASFGKREPELAEHISQSLSTIAEKIALAGAPGHTVRDAHQASLAVILTCLEAYRRAHFELWKETEMGRRLAALAGEPPPRRRKRHADSGRSAEDAGGE